MKCPYCGAQISGVYFSTTCPSCSKPLHTCRACAFYSPSSHYGCRENVDELVQDKDRSNFCDSYRLTDKEISGNKSDDALRKLESMFNF